MTRTEAALPEVVKIDPTLDLVLERVVDVAPELVWKAWTEPEHLKKWFTPRPWQTVECEIDLRPGGVFRTVMLSPEGQKFPGTGCYLDVVPGRRIVWTSVLLPGWRPAPPTPAPKDANDDCHDLAFTAIITIEPHGKGTKYTAIAIHPTAAGRDVHEKMGFHDGWGTALDQLVEWAKGQ